MKHNRSSATETNNWLKDQMLQELNEEKRGWKYTNYSIITHCRMNACPEIAETRVFTSIYHYFCISVAIAMKTSSTSQNLKKDGPHLSRWWLNYNASYIKTLYLHSYNSEWSPQFTSFFMTLLISKGPNSVGTEKSIACD